MKMKVEIDAGTDIDRAFDDTIKLANKVGCTIYFIFNGVECFCFMDGNTKTGVRNYHKALKPGSSNNAFNK